MASTPLAAWSPAQSRQPNRTGPREIGSVAELHLDGRYVGLVRVTGWDASWGFGRFQPNEAFSAFAVHYGAWSLLMHEDIAGRLSRPLSAELSHLENALDRIRGRLFFPADGKWVDLFQLNIDADLLEWKEY